VNLWAIFIAAAVGLAPSVYKEVQHKGAYVPFRRPFYPTTNVVIRWETPNHELPFVSQFEVVSSTNLLTPLAEWGIEAIVDATIPKSVGPDKSGALTSQFEVKLPVIGRGKYFLIIPQ
jgi:hypothetical protein